ncbi:Acylpyruvase fahd1, mitochondrial [Desmophyllum pertusum]|uniref:oxaloacetate tautomerase n=1 Tax=Desmophyllum pertusum TaxID=174260 RepID=A0A9W9Z5A4_9CNID|nr:Acylpyruvase fahd1, mitochondrial [Desmophyllum pertusum]
MELPPGCEQLHHEVELGVVIGKTGVAISESNAMDHVGGYALALDMTARDIQSVAKKLGYPWTFAKGFDTALPISKFIPKAEIPKPDNVHLWLKVDGKLKQDGNTRDLIFKIPYLISYISQTMTLEKGDLILTGTPEGVSAVKPGQTIVCGLGDQIVIYPVDSVIHALNNRGLGGERHCERKVPYPRTQPVSDPGKRSNLNCSTPSSTI